MDVDRTKVKPVVKITGEFWASLTEGDGNFNMFRFLEREGAQVIVEPVATWVAYLLCQAKARALNNKEVKAHHEQLAWYDLPRKFKREMAYQAKILGFTVGESMWAYFYHRVGEKLGGLAHKLVDQRELARLAEPFYHRFARGGEGHLEVGKNVYYTVHHKCHMVLALKPFGCMPSSQSDGVQSAVINKFKDMIFLPIETSGEGEVNAHSRVQMALGEAKAKAKAEFETVLDIHGQAFGRHPRIRRRSSRASAALLPRSASRRHRRHGGAIRPARQRSNEPRLRSAKVADMETRYMVGLDVGSTTVKAIVAESASDKVVWQDYQRHETKQPEKVLEFLRRIEEEAGVTPENSRAFITGSGGGTLAELVGAKFVQEVTAVSLAVEKMHPEVYSVIELGGQDAKIIVFKDDPESGRKKKIPSMNDKCAGGTGAVIDKINAKLKIPAEQLSLQGYDGIKLHKVAGKCGVFAETDVNGLQKEGTPSGRVDGFAV